MSPNSRLWLVGLGAAIAGAILGAGVVWMSTQSSVAALNVRVVKADADTQAALQRVDELAVQLHAAQGTSTTPAVSTSTTTSKTSTPTVAAKTAKPAVKTVKQFTFIKKVDQSGPAPVVTADYAQMLTGTAANKAATAHGDESPPPNDYYIVNDNHLLRKLKVKSGISVTVTTNPDGTVDPTGHIVTFANWAANYAAPTAANASLRSAPYWIWVKGDTITRIDEQYLP
jgi:hypothetical protein